jgi:hypothetical protein
VARLKARLLPIRSLWFPTRAELRAWEHSGLSLYVRPLSPTDFEVGPRLYSMWAAAFSPVLRARMTADERGTQLTWKRAWPRFTLGVLILWWVATAGWAVSLFPGLLSGDEHPAWMIFWGLLALSSTAGAAVGWVQGGHELDGALAVLDEALRAPDVDEDW